MKKNWKSSPWVIRILFIYWIIPLVIIIGTLSYSTYVLTQTDIQGMWRLPIDMLRSEYEIMPIATSVDFTFSVISLLSVYYGWRLLRGSGIARAILEVFTWLNVIYALFTVFPELKYFELEIKPTEFKDIPVVWLVFGFFFVLLDVAVLILVRSRRVREYANVF